MYVHGDFFFVSNIFHIKFGTSKKIKYTKSNTLMNCVRNITNHYNNRGLRIDIIIKNEQFIYIWEKMLVSELISILYPMTKIITLLRDKLS